MFKYSDRHPEDRDFDLVQQYSNEIKLWARHYTEKKDHPYPPCVVEGPDGVYEITYENSVITTYNRAIFLAKLLLRIPNLTITSNPELIPVRVISEGKPAVAAYLTSIHGYTESEICGVIDVSPRTVQQYISDFKNDRR